MVDENTNVVNPDVTLSADSKVSEPAEQNVAGGNQGIIENNAASMVDKQAYEALLGEINRLNAGFNEVKSKAEKIDKISSVLRGEDETETKEKFVKEFVEDPERVIRNIQKETIEKEVTPLKEQLRQKELKEADSKAIEYLKRTDPNNFDLIVSNMQNYVAKDFENVKDNPDRFEYLYALTKTRMERDLNMKAAQIKASGEAKAVSNVNAVSAQPNVVTSQQPESPNQQFLSEIENLKKEHRSDEVLDKWLDVLLDENNPNGFWSKHGKD